MKKTPLTRDRKAFPLMALALVLSIALFAACGSEEEAPEDAAAPEQEECDTSEVTTDSGLIIQDIECGTGDEAQTGEAVTVHYVGTLEDGTQFDSSRDRGEPFSFPLGAGQVIPGWDEGVVGMKPGGIRKLTIPSDLAYGDAGGRPPVIPPKATLIFEIELIESKAP